MERRNVRNIGCGRDSEYLVSPLETSGMSVRPGGGKEKKEHTKEDKTIMK